MNLPVHDLISFYHRLLYNAGSRALKMMTQTQVRLQYNLVALSFQIIDGAIYVGGMVLSRYYGSLSHPRPQGTIVRFVVALVSNPEFIISMLDLLAIFTIRYYFVLRASCNINSAPYNYAFVST